MTDTRPERDWDPLDPATFRDPARTYADLRQRCPVAYTDRWGGFWTLTRYDDVTGVAADYETFTTAIQNLVPRTPRSGVPRRPLQVDPPEHAHFRRAMNPYFEAGRVARLEPGLREVAARYLQPLLERGGGDAAEEYARHLPIRAVCAFLGVPEADADWIQERSARYVSLLAKDPKAAAGLSGELDDYARRLVAERHRAPLDPRFDIVSGLLDVSRQAMPDAVLEAGGGRHLSPIPPTPRPSRQREGDDRTRSRGTHLANGIGGDLGDHEVVASFVRGLLVAADRSTTHGISCGIFHLATHPDLQSQLRREPERLPDAIEEFVRLYAPSHATARTATRPVTLRGREIGKDEAVAMVWMAANRDPEVFPDPDTCRLDRRPNRHVGFGHGIHKCAGQTVARLQLRVALSELLARTRRFELVGPVPFATWPEYGPTALPIRLTAG